MSTFSRTALLSMLLAVCSLSSGRTLFAQQERPEQGRTPVTLVLTERLRNPDHGFVVQRANVEPNTVIVLPADNANANTLSLAVWSLIYAWPLNQDKSARSRRLRLRLNQTEGGPESLTLPWAQRVVDEAVRAPFRNIPEFGRVRAVEFWLPLASGGM